MVSEATPFLGNLATSKEAVHGSGGMDEVIARVLFCQKAHTLLT